MLNSREVQNAGEDVISDLLNLKLIAIVSRVGQASAR